MKKVLTVLIAALLIYWLVSGVVMNALMIIVAFEHSFAVTAQLLCALYLTSIAVVVMFLWLIVQVGSSI